MRTAVVVSACRTPIGKAGKGAYASLHPVTMCSHVVRHAVARAGIDPQEVDEVVNGSAVSVGPALGTIARQAALRAGLPSSVSGLNVTRACASGLQSIATAAYRVVLGELDISVAAGTEMISLQMDPDFPNLRKEPWLEQNHGAI